MLLKHAVVDGIVEGRIRCVFRRWAAPRAVAGGRQRTPRGELAIDAVTEVPLDALTEADARASGHPDLAALKRELSTREGRIFRIDLHYAGEDPRVVLRNQPRLTDADVAELRRRLARKDRDGAWTEATLRLIGERPGVLAAELAAAQGLEKLPFKRRVRQLKELGLTISLPKGYELSPRGRAWLAVLDETR